jgi:hypothetical protein
LLFVVLLNVSEGNPSFITIYGYLARDFKRSKATGVLRPAPYIYTNKKKESEFGYVVLLHPKSRNRNTNDGMKVMSATPSGLSGCPMLDSHLLANGQVCILGVFTDYIKGEALSFGESSTTIIKLLETLK